MASSRTFEGVSPECWKCMQDASVAQYHTVFDPPPPATEGTAVSKTPVGEVKMDFSYDESAQTVSYTLTHKPFVIPEGQLWDGIAKSITKCSGG
jgi:hypothetical protein